MSPKELLIKHNTYWKKMLSLLEDATKGNFPTKQLKRKTSYLNFLKNEIKLVHGKIEALKLEVGGK
jgi:hypothetical protein